MDDILQSPLRRYHIEAVADDNPLGITYRAFSRRKISKGISRRYYAVVEKAEEALQSDFNASIKETIMASPFQIHIEETFANEGRNYVVLAKGEAPRVENPVWKSLKNKGYLMLFLSAFILILLIIRLFQSPDVEQVAPASDDHAIESVDL